MTPCADLCGGAEQVEQRLLALSPQYAIEQHGQHMSDAGAVTLNSKVLELMQSALDPVKQIGMPCLWHPWA